MHLHRAGYFLLGLYHGLTQLNAFNIKEGAGHEQSGMDLDHGDRVS